MWCTVLGARATSLQPLEHNPRALFPDLSSSVISSHTLDLPTVLTQSALEDMEWLSLRLMLEFYAICFLHVQSSSCWRTFCSAIKFRESKMRLQQPATALTQGVDLLRYAGMVLKVAKLVQIGGNHRIIYVRSPIKVCQILLDSIVITPIINLQHFWLYLFRKYFPGFSIYHPSCAYLGIEVSLSYPGPPSHLAGTESFIELRRPFTLSEIIFTHLMRTLSWDTWCA